MKFLSSMITASTMAIAMLGSNAVAQPAPTSIEKAALVFAIGGLGDGSYNDQTWAGLQSAGADFDFDVAYHEPGAPENRDTVLTQVANSDSDFIIATGTMFSDTITDLAENHTTQSFVCLDYAHDGPMSSNLSGISFREQEGAFLVGMIAAFKSNTGKIGFVGATPIPLIQRFQAGYAQGARYAVPGIQVSAVFASPTDSGFDDPIKGKELANELIDNGVDVIFHASGSTGLGVIEAAEERGIMAIGVDKDQSDQAAPGVVISSLLKKEDVVIYDVIRDTLTDGFPSGQHSYGLKEGALDYVYDPAILGAYHDDLENAKEAIINGDIVVNPVPGATTAAQNWALFE